MAGPHVIKKYANRRLYHAAASRHVTLDDLRALVAKGESVQVIDDRTGEDITRAVLLQIIAEQEQFGRPILSIPVLEALIRLYGNSMQEFMTRYLEESMRNFGEQQAAAQAQLARLMSATPLTSIADIARQNLDAWARMQEAMLGAMSDRPQASESASSEPSRATKSQRAAAEGGHGKESPGSGRAR